MALATVRNCFPPVRDMAYVLAASAFLIFLQAIVISLLHVPAWILRMGAWDLVGVIAYVQAFALVDSLALWGGLLLLAVILPATWLRDSFLTRGSVIAFVSVLWASIAPCWASMAESKWGIRPWLNWVLLALLYVGLVAALCWLVWRHRGIAERVASITKKLSVLSSFYILLGLLGLLIVVVRNIV